MIPRLVGAEGNCGLRLPPFPLICHDCCRLLLLSARTGFRAPKSCWLFARQDAGVGREAVWGWAWESPFPRQGSGGRGVPFLQAIRASFPTWLLFSLSLPPQKVHEGQTTSLFCTSALLTLPPGCSSSSPGLTIKGTWTLLLSLQSAAVDPGLPLPQEAEAP